MAEPAKTAPTGASVDAFLAAVADPARRADAAAVCAMMREATGEPPVMWGTAIVGFGQHRYVYDSGRSGDWFLVGLSPRKAALTLYLGTVEGGGRAELLGRLGKHTVGKGCLYVKRLSDVDPDVLRALIAASVADMRARYGASLNPDPTGLTDLRAAALLAPSGFPTPSTAGWAAAIAACADTVAPVDGEPIPTWSVGAHRVRHRAPGAPLAYRDLVCSCGGRACEHVAGVLLAAALADPAHGDAPAWELVLDGLWGDGTVEAAPRTTGALRCEVRLPAPGQLGLGLELSVVTADGAILRCPKRPEALAALVGDGQAEAAVHAGWLALARAQRLERGQTPVLVRHLTRALLEPLSRLRPGQLRVHGAPIRASTAPLAPRLQASEDADGGLTLAWTPPIAVVWPDVGVALCADHLRPLPDRFAPDAAPALARAVPPVPRAELRRFLNRIVDRKGLAVDLPAHLDPWTPVLSRTGRLVLSEVRGELHVRLDLVYCSDGDEVVVHGLAHTVAPLPSGGAVLRDLGWETVERRAFAEVALEAGASDADPLVLDADRAVGWLRDRLPALAARWEVHGEERLIRLNVRGALSPRIRFDEGQDWFDLDVGFTVADREVRAEAVLASWRRGERYHRLEDGTLAELPLRWLARHGHAVVDLTHARRVQRKLGSWHAWMAADLLREGGFGERWLAITARDGVARTEPPAGLRATLRPYQRQGLDWLCFLRDHGLHGILADEMGLGKTVQALAAILDRRMPGDPPALVVTPTSVVSVWRDEAARFAPGLRVVVRHGPRRSELPLTDADLVITSYALLRRDVDALAAARWSWLVLDEGQAIKNPTSATARAARRLGAAHRLVLTGTPLENDLVELWSLFQFLMPGWLGRRTPFYARYAVAQGRREGPGVAPALDELHKRIRPFVLRRRKRDVATELPPKTEITVRVDLSDRERALYERIRATVRAEIAAAHADRASGGVPRRSALVLEGLTRLRQACCHPALLPFPEARAVKASAKLDALLERLDQALPAGARALVFSQWVRLLDQVAIGLEARRIAFLRLDGRTRDRAGVVAAFQAADGPPVMLVSIKAGGTGLTLTSADLVFHLDPWWNPAVEDQATDRAHRIGQVNPVTVFKLVAADTVEDRVLALQGHKRGLFDQVVDQSALDVSALTTDDLLALLDLAPL